MPSVTSPSQYTYVACWCYVATSQHPWSAAQARWSPPSVEQAAYSTAPPQPQNERPRHNDMLTDLEKSTHYYDRTAKSEHKM